MGKKSGPAAPAAPDPMATAQAQTQVNRDAAITQANLNRINQYTPEGSLTYSQNGTNADGTPIYSSTQSYSPAEQAKYDSNNRVALALNGLAENNVGRVADAQATPFSYDGMQQLQTRYGGNNPYQLQTVQPVGPVRSNAEAGVVQDQLQVGSVRGDVNARNVQDTVNARDVQTGSAGAGTAQAMDPSLAGKGIQQGLDYNGLTKLPGTSDFGAEGQRMADSVYNQAASRLDPRFKQMDDDQRARLAAQGITENSDAYRRDSDNLSRDRNDAYNQAAYSAQSAGAQEQSRLFGLAMGARQQGQNEVNTQGQFTNAAQQQGFGQQLSASDQAAQIQNQNYNQNLSQAQLYNQSQQQRYQQEQGSAELYNQAQQQRYGQEVGSAGLYNDAQQQAFAQRGQAAEFFNQAQDTRFQQKIQNADLYNGALQQQFGMNAAQAAMNNENQNQYFNQAGAVASFNNAARQQQIQEAAYLRNMPLNDIASLMSGNQAAAPQFSAVPQAQVQGGDYQGMVQSNYQTAVQQQQAKQAARSQALGSIFGAAGSAAMAFSDKRLKDNIVRIGTLANGIPTYAFKYIGDAAQQFGVIAQEVLGVRPDAVSYDEDGYMLVDYGKVYA
jgi:hypothetical protein